jgi:hypothetical protein
MAESRTIKIDLGLTQAEDGSTITAQLELETRKHSSGGITSNATVFWVGNHMKRHAFSLGSGRGDFEAKVAADRNAKATQKAIDYQHHNAFTPQRIAELTEAAKAHYANQQKQSAA